MVLLVLENRDVCSDSRQDKACWRIISQYRRGCGRHKSSNKLSWYRALCLRTCIFRFRKFYLSHTGNSTNTNITNIILAYMPGSVCFLCVCWHGVTVVHLPCLLIMWLNSREGGGGGGQTSQTTSPTHDQKHTSLENECFHGKLVKLKPIPTERWRQRLSAELLSTCRHLLPWYCFTWSNYCRSVVSLCSSA